MIIDFSVRNFRSLRNEQNLSLETDKGKSKVDNTFTFELSDETESRRASEVHLLKTAVIYGANASGKSNVVRALFTFRNLVLNSSQFKVDRRIPWFQPFELDPKTEEGTTQFGLTFIVNRLKYKYDIEYNAKKFVAEKLSYYPKGQPALLFERTNVDESTHEIKFGDKLRNKPLRKEVFCNQLFLSKFGSDEPNDQLTPVFRYFDEFGVANALDRPYIDDLVANISEDLCSKNDHEFAEIMEKLLKVADTKIEGVSVREDESVAVKFPDDLPEEIKDRLLKRHKYRIFTKHSIYADGVRVGEKEFDFNNYESAGTKILYALGGLILLRLRQGGTIVFDELDNSLHPLLARFLVRLFNNPISNPLNAQLIFATHEVTLLDRELFRKDQIWFTEKNSRGETELLSAQDFLGLRDTSNFETWYRTGKFGGNPHIKEVEFIFRNGQKKDSPADDDLHRV